MTIIALTVFAFAIIRLIVALVNNVTGTHLPFKGISSEKKVSVLIPARNEEDNIGNILNDLRSQSYNNIEVIIFNDQSGDRTEDIVREYTDTDSRFRLISSDHLPEGWYGKNHACHFLADSAAGDYFLFLDADVRIAGSLIADSVSLAEDKKTGLISIFPEQTIVTTGEAITVPNMNFILLSLLPLVLTEKSSYPSLAAANGQFMFFDAGIYMKMKPHEKMKMEKVEDIGIARYFKRNGIRVSCLLGDDRIRCRMYKGFSDAVNGFSKNVVSFFGDSFLLAIMFWLATSFGFLAVLKYMTLTAFLIYIAAEVLVRILISSVSRQHIMKNLLYLLPLQLSMGIFIYKAFTNKYFGHFEWKGRKLH